MRRAILVPLAVLALAGCGEDKTKTVTETRTVTVTTTTTAQPADERTAILNAAQAFYEASGGGVVREDLSVVKTNGRFADVLVAGEAHAILKKGGNTWVVVFDGNGAIPPAVRDRFGIPTDYGG